MLRRERIRSRLQKLARRTKQTTSLTDSLKSDYYCYSYDYTATTTAAAAAAARVMLWLLMAAMGLAMGHGLNAASPSKLRCDAPRAQARATTLLLQIQSHLSTANCALPPFLGVCHPHNAQR